MPRRKPTIDLSQDDMVDPKAFERIDPSASILGHLRLVSLADADAALYGSRGPEASPEKKAFRALEMVAQRDPSIWTPEDKTAIIDYVSQMRRWLDDLEAKAK